jgi:hypothetical protein
MPETIHEPEVTTKPSLQDIPDEILLDHLLPVLPLKDLLTFSLLSTRYHELAVRPFLPTAFPSPS